MALSHDDQHHPAGLANMRSSSKIYGRHPLDPSKAQIRLIHLQPYVGTDAMTCTLTLACLDEEENCPYEALSYEWGMPDDTSHSITLDGQKISIRQNLWWALWYLREENTERTFWIDALCIDQGNSRERNHQVGQMGKIYARANRVVAWLGLEEQELQGGRISRASDAFHFAQLLYGISTSNPGRYFNGFQGWHNEGCKKSHQFRGNLACITQQHPGWQSLLDLCRRSYWSRLWIIQELALASDAIVQCGKLELNWYIFDHIFEQKPNVDYGINSHIPYSMGANPFKNPPTRQRIPSLWVNIPPASWKLVTELVSSTPAQIYHSRKFRQSGTQSYALLEVVHMFKEGLCEDLRDKIFGLVGLSNECCQKAINTDYKESLHQICTKLLFHYFKYHAEEYCSGQEPLRRVSAKLIRDTFRILRAESGLMQTPSHFPFSDSSAEAMGTSIATLACKFRGQVIWENRTAIPKELNVHVRTALFRHLTDRDGALSFLTCHLYSYTTRYQGSNTFGKTVFRVLERMLIKSWLKSMTSRRKSNDNQSVLFFSDCGIATEAFCDVQIGDMLWSPDHHQAILLRREGERLLIMGVVELPRPPHDDISQPPKTEELTEFSDCLTLDLTALWCLCWNFDGCFWYKEALIEDATDDDVVINYTQQ